MDVKAASGRFASADVSGARIDLAARATVGKTLAVAPGAYVRVANARLAAARRAALLRAGAPGAGTPIAPLAAALGRAAAAAAQDFGGEIGFGWASGGPVRIGRITLASASGVRATVDDSDIVYDPDGGALRVAGRGTIGGGGMPALDVQLARSAAGAATSGVVRLQRPFAVDGASIAFTPLRFGATPRGNSRFATTLTLSGPLGTGGRIEALELPVQGLWNGRDRVVINPDCATVGWRTLTASGLALHSSRVRLCPVDGAMVAIDGKRLGGGVSVARPRLSGTLGSAPVTLVAATARVGLRDLSFALQDVAVRLGSPERLTRLDFTTLRGARVRHGLAGTFAGGGGQIGVVPLILSAAQGSWTFDTVLRLTGALTVSDAAALPRFKPLAARSVALELKRNVIDVTGRLFAPERDVLVADMTLRHDLSSGAGQADLDVPGLVFAEKDLQPDMLTRLTEGVIANVVGTVTGGARILWSPEGVTSTGTFRTKDMNLAAALGPVGGITTEIRFTDLLALQSAPGQIATIKSINTGIVVSDGVIRYQTLPNARVQVERGSWPFAGGTLTLEPTLLDFSDKQQRNMTLTVKGMEAAKFLQQFDFDNLAATGTFDGQLPMIFDSTGGRIENGALRARSGGGTIAYLGEVSKENLGVWGNLAFQALRSLEISRPAIDHERAAVRRDGDRGAFRRAQPGRRREEQFSHPPAATPAVRVQREDQGAVSRTVRFGTLLLRSAPAGGAQPACA